MTARPLERTDFPIRDLVPIFAIFLSGHGQITIMEVEGYFLERRNAFDIGIVEEPALPFILNELVLLFLGPIRLVGGRNIEADHARRT